MEDALRGVESSLILEHRPLILAYYRAEATLAAAPTWDDAARARLQRAAESLNSEPGAADLAARLLTQADRPTPDQHELQELALSLRKRIILTAGDSSGEDPAAHKP